MTAALLAVLCLLAAPAGAANFHSSARGTTSAPFLELGVGARAAAMGEAHSAVADDATALYWNPAALTRIKTRSTAFMHSPYVNGSYFDYAAYGQRLGERGAIGAGLQYFSPGRITETGSAGTDIGVFTPYDLALTLGYAHKLGGSLEGYSAGFSGKFIRSRIIHTAQTGAVDAGVLSPALLAGKLRLAVTMTNLGGTLQFDREEKPLPFALRLGSVYQAGERVLLSADVGLPRNDRPFAALGGEYRLRGMGPWSFAGRAGFNSQTIGSIEGFTGVSTGVGIGFERWEMDYAFVPFGAVGQAHRLSLTYSF